MAMGKVYLFNPTATKLTVTVNSEARSATNFEVAPTSKEQTWTPNAATPTPIERVGDDDEPKNQIGQKKNILYVFPEGRDNPSKVEVDVGSIQTNADLQIYLFYHGDSFGHVLLNNGVVMGFQPGE